MQNDSDSIRIPNSAMKCEVIMPRTRIFLVDDHAVVTEGLKRALRACSDFKVVGESISGREAVKGIKTLKPDVVIMDISMPDLNGLGATLRIKAFDSEVPVVIYTMYSDKEHIISLFNAGISAYILKEDTLSELILAIRAVGSGGSYFSEIPSKVLSRHIKDLEEGKNPKSGIERVSLREREVLKLLAEGKSIKKTAAELCISPKTVESHKYNIMEKLEARTVVELTKIAIKSRLIEL